MHHHAGIKTVVGSHIEKLDLSSSSLLRWSTDENDLSEERVLDHRRPDSQQTGNTSDGNEVVTTSVTDSL